MSTYHQPHSLRMLGHNVKPHQAANSIRYPSSSQSGQMPEAGGTDASLSYTDEVLAYLLLTEADVGEVKSLEQLCFGPKPAKGKNYKLSLVCQPRFESEMICYMDICLGIDL